MKRDIEDVERSCLRLVVRAIQDYKEKAKEIFRDETDDVDNRGEDITREALDTLGVSRVHTRLYGKIDYKRAAIVFLPDREIKVALMIDSKAEKDGNTATLQMSQTSMEVRQKRSGKTVAVKGTLPPFIEKDGHKLQTVTIIVKYVYSKSGAKCVLERMKIACVPSGCLQDDYNRSETDTIWMAGRNAPTLGEDFRVRLSFSLLAKKAAWRVVSF